ncbi:hypothetical protein DIPPA_16386 [Diplonema papillatum]|nr:hypothetical protein DIPPA_32850 [Diplonema papillatum]KAJ9468670.1 hypothetical protein DIPPA_16386 [Diplonema papillatum]
MSDLGSTAYQSLHKVMSIDQACLVADGVTDAFSVANVHITATSDNFASRIVIEQEFVYLGKRPTHATYATPLCGWRPQAIAINRASPAAPGARSALEPVEKQTLFSPGHLAAKVPWRIYAEEVVSVTVCLLKDLDLVDGHTGRMTIPRELFGAAREPADDWQGQFVVGRKQPAHKRRARGISVAVSLNTFTHLVSAGLPTLPGADKLVMDITNRGANGQWSKKFDFHDPSVDPIIGCSIQADMTMASADTLLQLDIVSAADADGGSVVPLDDQYSIVVSMFPTEQILGGAANPDEPNLDCVFILDSTWGMAAHFDAAKASVRQAIMTLPRSCSWNLITYGGAAGNRSLSATGEALENTTEHVQRAKEMLAAAEMAGRAVDVSSVLKNVLARPPRDGCGRLVFLLVGSPLAAAAGLREKTRECMRLAKDHADTTRFCTFALNQADPAALRYMAEATGGAHSASAEGLESAVLDAVSTSVVPCLVRPDLAFFAHKTVGPSDEADPLDGVVRPCYPMLPLLFVGERRWVYCFATGDLPGGGLGVSLNAFCGETAVSVTETVNNLRPQGNPSVRCLAEADPMALIQHATAAVERVSMLVDPRWAISPAGHTTPHPHPAADPTVHGHPMRADVLLFKGKSRAGDAERAEIVRLSQTYGLVTPFTAMVLAPAAAGGGVVVKPNERTVAAEYPTAWIANERELRMLCGAPEHVLRTGGARAVDGTAVALGAEPEACRQGSAAAANAAQAEKVAGMVRQILLEEVVASVVGCPKLPAVLDLQEADGAWLFEERTSRVLGVPHAVFQDSIPGLAALGTPPPPEEAAAEREPVGPPAADTDGPPVEQDDSAEPAPADEDGGQAAAEAEPAVRVETPEVESYDWDAFRVLSSSWATASALALLNLLHQDDETTLPLASRKGVLFLRKHGNETWVQEATSFIQKHSIHGDKELNNPYGTE